MIDVSRFEQAPMEANYLNFPVETILDKHGGVIAHSAKYGHSIADSRILKGIVMQRHDVEREGTWE